jgi:ABC-2 type transport system permease protein
VQPVGAVSPVGTVSLNWRAVRTEVAKGLRLTWRRRSMFIVGLIVFGLTYVGISFFIGGGHLVKALMVQTLPALLAVAVIHSAGTEGAVGIAEEVHGGTMDQAQLSPASPQLLALGRMTALVLEGLAAATILGPLFILGLGLDIHFHPAALVPALLTVLDALGYGLIMIALTIRVVSIGAIVHVAEMAIMAFGGMVLPISLFPRGVEIFARLVPTALGVQALNTTLAGRGIGAIWSDHTLPWLLIHTATMIMLGLVLYLVNVRHARREGGLSPR